MKTTDYIQRFPQIKGELRAEYCARLAAESEGKENITYKSFWDKWWVMYGTKTEDSDKVRICYEYFRKHPRDVGFRQKQYCMSIKGLVFEDIGLELSYLEINRNYKDYAVGVNEPDKVVPRKYRSDKKVWEKMIANCSYPEMIEDYKALIEAV